MPKRRRWTPAFSTARNRARAMSMSRIGFVTVAWVLACAGGTLVGCSFSIGSGTPIVAKADLQKDVSAQLEKVGVNAESVTCKEDLVGEVGKTTRCEVVLSPTNSFEPIVTATKVEGTEVSYELAPAVSKEQLEKQVASLVADASGEKVDSVVCDGGLQGKQGFETHCEVTVGGVAVRRTVEVTKVTGLLMNFNLVPVLAKAKLQESLLDQLAEQLGQRPETADCPGDLAGKPGTTMECTVDIGGESMKFVLTVTSTDGDRINYSYESKG